MAESTEPTETTAGTALGSPSTTAPSATRN